MTLTAIPVAPGVTRHIGVLDGWRGVSILLVLGAHLLPLGPKRWDLNEAVAAAGMALFFTLSGFLITTFLLRKPNVPSFLVRRFCRIVPLAWLYMLGMLALAQAPWQTWAANLFFYANLPPFWLQSAGGGHLWSLCAEMQFYVGIALLVWVLGRRALWWLPLICLGVTGYRIATGQLITIVTWARVDEILAGAILALLFDRELQVPTRSGAWPVSVTLFGLLVLASHPAGAWLNYARPYLAAGLVGTTLFAQGGLAGRLLRGRVLGYLATISYALYVIHGALPGTWLGSGGTLERYLKRPLLFGALWLLAHVSTTQYESRFIALGHRWSKRFEKVPA